MIRFPRDLRGERVDDGGRRAADQAQFFYAFNLDDRIPRSHLLRRIDVMVTEALADVYREMTAFYSHTGRPSIDPDIADADADRGLLLRHPVRAEALRRGLAEFGLPMVLPDRFGRCRSGSF